MLPSLFQQALREELYILGGVRQVCLLVLFQAIALGAAHRVTSADVSTLVFTSLYSDHDDDALARDLKKSEMTEQLSPHLVRYFQLAGTGPRALAALQELQEKSKKLPPPAERALTIQPVPLPDEQTQILKRVTEYARGYVHALPDFLCDQVTSRYTNLKGRGADRNARYGKKLRPSDSFTRVLRFARGAEESQVMRVNNKPAKGVSTRFGQSISSGEFGGDMVIIFGPGVNPDLVWDHWETFRGKRTAVFSYFVRPGKSEFSLYYCCFAEPGIGDMQQSYKSPIRGLLYVDAETGLISRLMIRAVELPAAFRVKESNTIIDYGIVSIAGKAYTLPLRALMFTHSDYQRNRNEIQFLNYRKFEAESIFTYTESKVSYGAKTKK